MNKPFSSQDMESRAKLARESESKREHMAGLLQLGLIAGILVAAFAINFVLMNSSSKNRSRSSGPSVITVAVVQPTTTDALFSVRETGTIQARNYISLSPQVGGRVLSVSPDLAVGGAFEADEVLFTIDTADFDAALEQARANYLTAESNLALETAEAEIARREWALINPDELIPALVARKPQIAQARASLASAKAGLGDAELDLSRTKYSLPFDGRVISTSIEPGKTVGAGQAYGDVYGLDSLEIAVALSDRNLDTIEPAIGRAAKVITKLNGKDVELTATVIRKDAQLDSSTRLARLILTFDDPQDLLPGTFVEVVLQGNSVADAYVLPAKVVGENGKVWVAENGVMVPRVPTILSLDDENAVLVPFDVGDGVITTPIARPNEGTAVKIEGSDEKANS